MEDSNNMVMLHFEIAAFAEDRQPFLDIGLTEQQVVELLTQQWVLKNNRDKEA